MLVSEILKDKGGDVFSVTPDITMAQACAQLDSRRVGALMVCENEGVIGVISERDVVRAVASDGPDSLEQTGLHLYDP